MQRIAESWPLRFAGDPVRRYVLRLGQKIVAQVDPHHVDDWRFFVVRNLEPTAFAVGGNRFVVSDGLIAFVRNESDLVAVLAHEIAHQRLRHFCDQAPTDAKRIRYGSIVQHFDLDTERAADAEAVRLLELAGYDSCSMYEVLRCLSERPGAPVSQLQARMRSLKSSCTNRANMPHIGELEEIRSHILDESGTPIQRCR
ncbi:peptidase M48 Ste24p [Thiorhodococcus drewsii AZ1]|uniref:Peptidase M48 Ste24p n=2 Tax=Thiorhodococcus drewsii TaxID=210408 RepID=G2E4Q1_9GAMM|nr:peptidase M48 Ste24p [Thiorhodococcus drewsii AZ1]